MNIRYLLIASLQKVYRAMTIPEVLIEECAKGTVVPFVGSGISLAVQPGLFPTWSELLENLALMLDKQAKKDSACIVRAHINKRQMGKAANEALDELGHTIFRRIMQEAFDMAQPADINQALLRALWSLKPKLIVSTNYDNVLQWFNPNARTVTNLQNSNLADLFHGSVEKPVIWHLHGHISDPDSLILAPQQYDCLYGKTNGNKNPYNTAQFQLNSLFANHRLLFLGFGLQDEYVMDALESVLEIFSNKSNSHYALLKQDDDRARELWKKYNIQVIEYADYGAPLVELINENVRLMNAKAEELTQRATTRTISIPAIQETTPSVSLDSTDVFVGRKDVLANLDEYWKRCTSLNQPLVVVLRGDGGVGKTFLARHFASKLLNKFHIKSWYGEANGGSVRDGLITLGVLSNLTLGEGNLDIQARTILKSILSSSVLIVDDVSDYAGIEDLGSLAGSVLVLVTTKLPDVPPSDCESLCLENFNQHECMDYFSENLSPSLRTTVSPEELCGVFNQIGFRNPFWMRLARMHLEDLATHKYSDTHSLLSNLKTTLDHDQMAHQRLLKFPFQRITENKNGRKLLLACSLFAPDGIPVDLLCETAGLLNEESNDMLKQLRHWGLVHSPETLITGPDRISMNRIWHEYVVTQFLDKSESDRRPFVERFVRSWMSFLSKAGLELALAMHVNIKEAVKLLLTLPDDGKLYGAHELTTSVLASLEYFVDPLVRAKFYLCLLFRTNDPIRIAHIYMLVSECFIGGRQFRQAEDFAMLAREIFENVNEQAQIAAAAKRLGTTYQKQGKFDESIEAFSQAKQLYDKLKQPHRSGDVLRAMSQTYYAAHSNLEAEKAATEAIDLLLNLNSLNSSIESRNSLAYAYVTLARVLLRKQQYIESIKFVKKGMSIHSEQMGDIHHYVAYDLRVLASAESGMGNQKQALQHLERASGITERFFGNSVALAAVRLAQTRCWLQLENTDHELENAIISAEKALNIIESIGGDVTKQKAEVWRLLGDAHYRQKEMNRAMQAAEKAENILLNHPTLSKTLEVAKVRLLKSQMCLQQERYADALRLLWEVRSEFFRYGITAELKQTDQALLHALIRLGINDWNRSAGDYLEYQHKFPDNVHNHLCGKLLEELEIVTHSFDKPPCVLDLFCGVGSVSRAIHDSQLLVGEIWGFDGSPEMIEVCQRWKEDMNAEDFQFFSDPNVLCCGNTPRFQIVTINMGIFQLDLRTRHFLFQRILRYLSDDCVVIFSTHAADFEFPTVFANEYPDINSDNPFKKRFFTECHRLGYNPPTDYADTITPVFAKDNYHNLSCFFEFYGFQLKPEPTNLLIHDIDRRWEDRIAFTRIPAISKKIFGKEIPQDVWDQLLAIDGSSDTAYGTVFQANHTRYNWKRIQCFSSADVDFSKGLPIRYATALVLRNQEGHVLFAKRGEGARDFCGEWSLPSCFSQEYDGGLEGSLQRSVKTHFGIRLGKMNKLHPLSIRFSQRSDDTGDWILAMCLLEGVVEEEEITLYSDKYSEVTWEVAWSFLNKLGRARMGDCTKSFSDFLRVIQGKDGLPIYADTGHVGE